MNGQNPFEVASADYDPCDPDSLPGRELEDYVKEPIEQWILENDTIEADTYRKARQVWQELGQRAIEPDAPDVGGPDALQPEYIRKVSPRNVKEFATRLDLLAFETVGLAAIGSDTLASLGYEPVMVGQMFGVPRGDGYAPVLALDTTLGGRPCIDELHVVFHLLNDIYSEDPREVGVLF